jgi:hypothetical protein
VSKLSRFLDRLCLRRLARRWQLRPYEEQPTDQVLQRMQQTLQRLTLMGTYDADDVFVIGYPRSGHTWVQNLLACVRFGCDGRETPDAVVQHLVPDVHQMPYYFRFAAPMFFKTHHFPRPEYRRVVYLLRDGRDVMVSYKYYLENVRARKIGRYQELKSLSTCGVWHDHVQAWLQNPHQAAVIIVRYEDLIADGERELRRICRFAGLDGQEDRIPAALASCRFANLREKEAVGGLLNGGWPGTQPFFRRGVVGSHRDELDPVFLEEFLAEAEPTLQQLGYGQS